MSFHVIDRDAFDTLLDALRERAYTIIGPTVRAGAIVLDEIATAADLPIGVTDAQDGGEYRLERRTDDALFAFAAGPHSWKKYQLPAELTLWSARRAPSGELTDLVEPPRDGPRHAWLGARACDLHAIAILDRVLAGGGHSDPADAARLENVFIIATQCTEAGGTCFCSSMGTGPAAERGFDLALTEVIDASRHHFLVEVGSERGADVVDAVPHRRASAEDQAEALTLYERARTTMGRSLDTRGLKELLYRNLDHPRWLEVAGRCLTCGNCTMVCPTCFCTTIQDEIDLTGERLERHQRWDSCFSVDYSYIHGGAVRRSARSRYRQWMTHKLATWWDQFDSSGCVGCGRCITWCPVGIDITEEAEAIRATEGGLRYADH